MLCMEVINKIGCLLIAILNLITPIERTFFFSDMDKCVANSPVLFVCTSHVLHVASHKLGERTILLL